MIDKSRNDSMPNMELLDFLSDVKLDENVRESLRVDMDKPIALTASELGQYSLEKYGVDTGGKYAGIDLPHPFGKAAGQLSMKVGHVKTDRDNGLAFTVLKSAVGITEDGEIGINDWERSAPKMIVEKRKARDGREGWTVTWKGRGWDKGFAAYVDFYKNALEIDRDYPVIPSLMVDVTNPDRAYAQAEFCLGKLHEIHKSSGIGRDFLVEIDISPTMSLLPGAQDDETFRNYVRTSVVAFHKGLPSKGRCVVKIPNSGRGAEFQLNLVRISIEESREKLAGLVIGNRLFDSEKVFEDQKGIAYGGFDLSDANLELLDSMQPYGNFPPLIGTGNIFSGKMMAEYAVRRCRAGELHTFFQLPADVYRAKSGPDGRIGCVIRELVFHPDDGLIAILFKLEKSGKLPRENGILSFDNLPMIRESLV
ncbi:MAG: hypothetical protein ABIC40_08255 [bacterium]